MTVDELIQSADIVRYNESKLDMLVKEIKASEETSLRLSANLSGLRHKESVLRMNVASERRKLQLFLEGLE